MHPIELRDNKDTNVTDIVFKDILSDTTRKIRRNLLLVSFITLFVVLDEVIIKSFMGVGLDESLSPEQLTPIIESALSVIILYLMITFGVYARVDHQQWWSAIKLTKAMNAHRLLGDIDYKLNDLLHRVSLYEEDRDSQSRIDDGTFNPVLENDKHDLSKLIKGFFYQTLDGEEVFTEDVKRLKVDQNQINDIFSEYRNLSYDQKFKYWLVDLGIPVTLSFLAFSKVWHGLVLFSGNLL
jgi:hypothetical protein